MKNCIFSVLIVLYFIFIIIHGVTAVLPNYSPATGGFGSSRNALITRYFNLGFSGIEIIGFLNNVHGIVLSLRQLRRILKTIGCHRRQEQDSLQEIVEAIEKELRFSGNSIGYRAMHQRLKVDHGLTVKREVVRKVLKILDPEGVSIRSQHRLRRRVYKVPGPNYLWHVDGYDKLKPFGFCVHGCIDGYSRRVLWLEVAYSNNDPKLVGGYYLDYVKELGGTARIIRSDRGTENGNIEIMQRFFRNSATDSFSGDKSFMYGKSTSNQRIEAWWGSLRKGCCHWWINHFKDLRDSGLFIDDNIIHQQCLRFCYMNVLQEELHKVAIYWNTHRIRPTKNSESPSGRPDVNYFAPQHVSHGVTDYTAAVSDDDINIVENVLIERTPRDGCSNEFKELVEMIMMDEGLHSPTTPDDAKQLYTDLLYHIYSLMP